MLRSKTLDPRWADRDAKAYESAARPLCVADVALFYGERSGGIRTYLDAKSAYAAQTSAFEHHVIVPGLRERHSAGRHELPSLRLVASNGYRLPLGTRALNATLGAIRPDVVLLHDPFWRPRLVTLIGRRVGARVVAVQHATAAGSAAGLPGPGQLYAPLLRAFMRHGARLTDAVMAGSDFCEDLGRHAELALRFGVDRAFSPSADARGGDHVLYVGRLSREKGIFELLDAAALSGDQWPLRLVGAGPAASALRARARRLGLESRVSIQPFIANREELARAYAEAACVVVPGRHETFGLVALEAAASGARVVSAASVPAAQLAPELVHTYAESDPRGLLEAIDRARKATPALDLAAALGRRFRWSRALEAELREIEGLVR